MIVAFQKSSIRRFGAIFYECDSCGVTFSAGIDKALQNEYSLKDIIEMFFKRELYMQCYKCENMYELGKLDRSNVTYLGPDDV